LEYFRRRGIHWHDGTGQDESLPSSHICCSQSACVNVLFPFIRNPDALCNVLQGIGYPAENVLPFVGDLPLQDGTIPCIAFEWIGTRNYLQELKFGEVASDTERTRGEGFTSADFAIRFRRNDKRIQIVLGEWKYTEYYTTGKSIQIAKSGTDRLDRVYRPALKGADSQIRLPAGTPYEALFFDPFDQMMRLQLLASAMEHEHETGADIVTVLHVAPTNNKELTRRITSPDLGNRFPDTDIHDLWAHLVAPDRFKGLFWKDLLPIITHQVPDKKLADYISTRYTAADAHKVAP
jgi:hypothetical protein